LAVVHRGVGDLKGADELGLAIRVDVVLVTEVVREKPWKEKLRMINPISKNE